MTDNKVINYLKGVLKNMPSDWLKLTTHRLDIYDESKAKKQFLEEFENLFNTNNSDNKALSDLPTAYDYIRLGHPLSCVLEWAVANTLNINDSQVISFSSQITPILAVLRKNLLENLETRIVYIQDLPAKFDAELIRSVYGYKFDLRQVKSLDDLDTFKGTTLFVANNEEFEIPTLHPNADIQVNTIRDLGSILLVNSTNMNDYINEIQHVRRRETIAMTPINCLVALHKLVGITHENSTAGFHTHKASTLASITQVTGAPTKPLVGSSGLSIQYAIMMGLVNHAQKNHPKKDIKFIVPTNCYGGTNDQARRVAACIENVEVVDLAVDGENDMVQSINTVLEALAKEDAIPYIIAEIPTNPRVEVPEMIALRDTLAKSRKTANGNTAVDPVFILDQTFCPNVLFLGNGEMLSSVRALSYASGSKFPSGGKCTAGYVVGNDKTADIMEMIETHLTLCDNEATALQYEYLAEQLPSMNERIAKAYANTRDFVNYIDKTLPEAKINFVSEELAAQGFTPSVFSLDLPTKGGTAEEKEAYKRDLNHKLINLMITEIPAESKYCVSYGQLKGCYWTIPATSTQGTTKEGDKDYIARVALSGNMDLAKHKEVFAQFVSEID